MIYNTKNQKFEHESKTFIIGEKVYATESAYYGLIGIVKEIRTENDKETDNPTPEIVCDFCAPILSSDIDKLEQTLGSNYTLDNIIMAPSMLTPILCPGIPKNFHGPRAYLVVEEWNYDGEGFNTEITVFADKESALMYFKVTLLNEYENGIIASFKEREDAAFDELDDFYEIYINGDYCNNNYTIRILEKFIID